MNKLLRCCEAVESAVAQLYQLLARNEQQAELRALWRQMAKDEQEHAAQLQFAQRLSGERVFREKDGALFGAMNELLRQTEKDLDMVRQERISGGRAIELAVELEMRFCQAHATSALDFDHEGLKKMFQALARADHLHVQGLIDYMAGRPEHDLLRQRLQVRFPSPPARRTVHATGRK